MSTVVSVSPTRVLCSIHPGAERPGYYVCKHVLNGAAVAHHKAPDPKMSGTALCFECQYFMPEGEAFHTVCDLCVNYNLPDIEMPVEASVYAAHVAGMEAAALAIAQRKIMAARNPFSGAAHWAYDLGVRCIVHVYRTGGLPA